MTTRCVLARSRFGGVAHVVADDGEGASVVGARCLCRMTAGPWRPAGDDRRLCSVCVRHALGPPTVDFLDELAVWGTDYIAAALQCDR